MRSVICPNLHLWEYWMIYLRKISRYGHSSLLSLMSLLDSQQRPKAFQTMRTAHPRKGWKAIRQAWENKKTSRSHSLFLQCIHRHPRNLLNFRNGVGEKVKKLGRRNGKKIENTNIAMKSENICHFLELAPWVYHLSHICWKLIPFSP